MGPGEGRESGADAQIHQKWASRGRVQASALSFPDSCPVTAQQGEKTHLSGLELGLNPELLTTILLF